MSPLLRTPLHTPSHRPARLVASCAVSLLLGGCGGSSLDTLDGPARGIVSGLVCSELTFLTAAMEVPAAAPGFVREGNCISLASPLPVQFLRTVTLPGAGRYSQFEYKGKDGTLKLWIGTDRVREG